MTWQPQAHTDQENLRWCWLRAAEWGQWPIFMSQPIAPILLVWLPWKVVVPGIVALNVFWAMFVRYRFVSVGAASLGPIFVLSKWITWPAATAYLFWHGDGVEKWVAALWPLLIFPLMFLPPAVGRIQTMFMRALGYEPTALSPVAEQK